jgi:hypothetical protein
MQRSEARDWLAVAALAQTQSERQRSASVSNRFGLSGRLECRDGCVGFDLYSSHFLGKITNRLGKGSIEKAWSSKMFQSSLLVPALGEPLRQACRISPFGRPPLFGDPKLEHQTQATIYGKRRVRAGVRAWICLFQIFDFAH